MLIGNTPQTTIRTDFVFIATDQQTVFTGTDSNNLVLSFDINNFDIFVNGLLLTRADFSNATGSAITLGFPRNAGDVVTVRSYGMLSSINALLPAKVDIATAGVYNSTRNRIINGDFAMWQRGTTQAVTGYASADRWNMQHSGTSKTANLQSFALGQTAVPGNPNFFLRHTVTSVAGANNFCNMYQAIESVQTFSGKTATITFYAKADAARNIAVETIQNFGLGGSPSAQVTGIGVTTCALTTSWQQFSFTVNVPSISGKTLGTQSNDSLLLMFWFDGGSSYNARNNSLGQQSGTFDIAHVSMVEGDATDENDPFGFRPYALEFALCQRYYERFGAVWLGDGTTGGTYGVWCSFKQSKRVVPAVTSIAQGPAGNGGMNARSLAGVTIDGATIVATMSAATGPSRGFSDTWQADSEL